MKQANRDITKQINQASREKKTLREIETEFEEMQRNVLIRQKLLA